MTKSNFWPIFPLKLQCKTKNCLHNVVYGSIMLKFFLVAHLTYENQWVSLRNKIRTFGFFGTPYSIYSILTYLFNQRLYIEIFSEWGNKPVFLFGRDPLYLQQHHQPFDNSAASVREPIITCHNSHTMKMMRLTRMMIR